MNPRYLVIADEQFNTPLHLSRADDLLESQGEADYAAEEMIRQGKRLVFVFKLERAYVPTGSRFVEVVAVDPPQLASHENYGGSGGED